MVRDFFVALTFLTFVVAGFFELEGCKLVLVVLGFGTTPLVALLLVVPPLIESPLVVATTGVTVSPVVSILSVVFTGVVTTSPLVSPFPVVETSPLNLASAFKSFSILTGLDICIFMPASRQC